MRRANGTGGITKLSGKRRKPWRARVTCGFIFDEKGGKARAKVKLLGDFETRVAAEKALLEYFECPYEIGSKDITFSELYEKWSDWYFNSKIKKVSGRRTVESAYSYCSVLYNIRVRDIRVHHLEDCMETAYIIVKEGKDKGKKRYASAGTKQRMKSLFNLMLDYAVRHEVVIKNYARDFKISDAIKIEAKKSAKKKVPFTYEEVVKLWDNVNDVKFVDMILIGIYTGFRPQELAILKLDGVNLENKVLFGGMKTEAGYDRYVPIHDAIYSLVEKRYAEAKEMNSEFLFNDPEGQNGTYMTYDKYRGRFKKAMSYLEMTHSPHETRHTFITVAKSCKLNDNILKLLVGHSIPDITERVYTHRTFKQLENEMKKFVPNEGMNDIDVDEFLKKLLS